MTAIFAICIVLLVVTALVCVFGLFSGESDGVALSLATLTVIALTLAVGYQWGRGEGWAITSKSNVKQEAKAY